MGVDVHTVDMGRGSLFNRTDRVGMVFLPGQAVVSATSLAVSGLDLPATYGVFAMTSWATNVKTGSRTNTGFTLTFGTTSGASDTVDILIVW